MFDNINCEYPLPVSKELIELEDFDIYEAEFQTKDLENALELYTITEDGDLIRRKVQYEWVDDDEAFLKGYMKAVSSEDIKENFHGVIEFYCYEQLRKEDDGKIKETSVTVDYEAKFIDGKLSSIELVNQSIEDTTDHYYDMKEFFRKQEAKRNKWYNKYFLYTKQFRTFKRVCIYKPLSALHSFTGKLLTLSHRI